MTTLESLSSRGGRLLRRMLERGKLHPNDAAYYGRKVSPMEVAEDHYRWNRLPPRLTEFCDKCGSEVRWFREYSTFDVSDGQPGYVYHLKCPHASDVTWVLENEPRVARPEGEESTEQWTRLFNHAYSLAASHYDAHLYATVHDDRASFANDELP